MFDKSKLLPGDHLLYGVKDFGGWVTSLKTFSPAVHIEVYIGGGISVASRNGIGVNSYPFRDAQLISVLRPNAPFDIEAALRWFDQPYDKITHGGVRGRPYGWLDLLRFYNIKIPTNGWICSQFVSALDAAGGFYPFSRLYSAGLIDPGDYLCSPMFNCFYITDKARKAIGP
jgi:hypothetical protein